MDLFAWLADNDGREWMVRGKWVGPKIMLDADDFGTVEDVQVSDDGRVWIDPMDAGLDPFACDDVLVDARFQQ